MGDASRAQGPFPDSPELERLLSGVISEHPGKVDGWMSSEPGCWGYLAGQAVLACRDHMGRQLTHQERRLAWSRLWSLLEEARGKPFPP